MVDFSSLPKLALWIIRAVCIAVSGMMAGLVAALLWVRHGADGFVFQNGEKETIGLMIVLIVAALILARVTGRELNRMLKD